MAVRNTSEAMLPKNKRVKWKKNGILFLLTRIESDSVEQSGHNLLEVFIQHAVDGANDTSIFCFETPVAKMCKNIKGSEHQRVQFYDCFYDHRNWLQTCGRKIGNVETFQIGSKCLQRVSDQQVVGSNTQTVFIDSLSPLVSATGSCNCYTQLHTLCNTGQVVTLVHEDALPDAQATLDMLRHLATTCLRVRPPSSASQGSPVVEIRHLKPGGSVLRQVERFTIGADKDVFSEKILSGSVSSSGTTSRPPDTSQLPPDLTTFKIDLQQDEKQARSKLVLPYIRPSMDSTVQSGGKVFYQPDEADDWDEEDPDDDLDV